MIDLAVFEALGLFSTALLLNLLPFTSPSNLFIALNLTIASAFPPLLVGFIVASAASTAKLVHYGIGFVLRGTLKSEKKVSLGMWSSSIILIDNNPLGYK